MPSDNYDLLAARLLSLLDGDILPLPKWGDLERNEQRIAIAVQDATGMTPEHWATLDRHSREPWLERTIAVVASRQEVSAADEPADGGENTNSGQGTEQPHTYTLGALVRDLAASESAYTANMKTADRVRSQQGSLVAHWWDVQAAVLRWRPDASRMPGIDRIELLCDARFGTGVTLENVRRLRAELCHERSMDMEAANSMTLNEVADHFHVRTKGESGQRPTAHQMAELLAEFRQIESIDHAQKRGFAFEKFLNRFFDLNGLNPRGSFRIVGEQIDGSFEWQSVTFLVEARWRKQEANASDLSVLHSKCNKSEWTRGLFISIAGFSDQTNETVRIGQRPNMVAMSGDDLRLILENRWTLTGALRKKLRHTGETGEVYLPLAKASNGE